MPGPFAITPSTSSITLDAARKGTVTFTVKNMTKMRIRGLGRLEAVPPESLNWYSLVPLSVPAPANGQPTPPPAPDTNANTRDFAPEDTQTFTVNVTVPPTAAPGEYRFKLIVANEVNPDDDFTESANVGFVVVPPVPPPPPPKFPIWIIPVILVILALVIVIVVLVVNREPTPPEPTPTAEVTPTVSPVPGLPRRTVSELRRLTPIFGSQAVNGFSFPSTNITLGVFNFPGVAAFTLSGADANNQRCSGLISNQPVFEVSIGSRTVVEFNLLYQSLSGSTTLIVLNPRGQVFCGDTRGAANSVTINPVVPGAYSIWIGTSEQSQTLTGTLSLTSFCNAFGCTQ